MLDMMDDYNLILLNGLPDCKGEITWQQNEKVSFIDYIFADVVMHKSFSCMTIDENKEIFDLSDHNLLVATFNVNTHGDRHFSKKKETNILFENK